MKFFEHYIEFVAGGSREDQSKEDYFHQMEYPADYKMYQTKLIKFDRDYENELQYNFYGMYPYQISNTPIRYETSQVLKMNVNFHIDRYSSGKYSSYDKYRGRHNNRDETKKAKDDTKTTSIFGAEYIPTDEFYDVFSDSSQNQTSFDTGYSIFK